MKTKEELNALKDEVTALNKKLAELSEDELTQVTGGFIPPIPLGVNPFHGISDGSSKIPNLNIGGVGPQEYDCSGLVT